MCGFGSEWIKEAQAHGPEWVPDVAAESQEEALIIFVKNPALGKVKTRLARTIGDAAAYEAYLHMLAHARATALQVDCVRFVYYSDFVDADDEWKSEDFHKAVQAAGDIGEKMSRAIEDVLALGYRRVLLVGSDLLDLQAHHLALAFRALRHYDAVLGPAADGGYYLIGMGSPMPSLFQGKVWSTASVAADTLADLRQMGKTVSLLPEISDIDTEADWVAALQRWHNRLPR